MKDITEDIEQLMADLRKLDPATKLAAILERCEVFGRRCVERETITTAIVALTPSGVGFRILDFGNQEEKVRKHEAASKSLAEMDAFLAIHISEGWQSTPKWNGRPSDDPNRREILMVNAIEPNARMRRSTTVPFERLGKRVHWLKAETKEGEQCILPPWRSKKAWRRSIEEWNQKSGWDMGAWQAEAEIAFLKLLGLNTGEPHPIDPILVVPGVGRVRIILSVPRDIQSPTNFEVQRGDCDVIVHVAIIIEEGRPAFQPHGWHYEKEIPEVVEGGTLPEMRSMKSLEAMCRGAIQ